PPFGDTKFDDTKYIHPAVEHEAAVRMGQRVDHGRLSISTYQHSCEPEANAALDAAAAGDGLPLAHVLEACTVHWLAAPNALIAVLPRVTRHRDELAAALRVFHDEWGHSTLTIPFSFVS